MDKFSMTFNGTEIEGAVTAQTLCDFETFFDGRDLVSTVVIGNSGTVKATDLLRAAWCCARTVNQALPSFGAWVKTVETWNFGEVRSAIAGAVKDSAFHEWEEAPQE